MKNYVVSRRLQLFLSIERKCSWFRENLAEIIIRSRLRTRFARTQSEYNLVSSALRNFVLLLHIVRKLRLIKDWSELGPNGVLINRFIVRYYNLYD